MGLCVVLIFLKGLCVLGGGFQCVSVCWWCDFLFLGVLYIYGLVFVEVL